MPNPIRTVDGVTAQWDGQGWRRLSPSDPLNIKQDVRDPVAEAKEFLARQDVLAPRGVNRTNSEAVQAVPSPSPPPKASALRSLLTGAAPALVGSGTIVAAHLLAPELSIPADIALGVLGGGMTGQLVNNRPVGGAIEGGLAGVPVGPILRYSGGKLVGTGESVARTIPWWGREMLARTLGLGHAGEIVSVAGPSVATGVGRSIEAAGTRLGEKSLGVKATDLLRKIFGFGERQGVQDIVEGSRPIPRPLSREPLPVSTYTAPIEEIPPITPLTQQRANINPRDFLGERTTGSVTPEALSGVELPASWKPFIGTPPPSPITRTLTKLAAQRPATPLDRLVALRSRQVERYNRRRPFVSEE